MNDITSRTSLAFLGILLILVSIASQAFAQTKCYNEPSPICKLPQLSTLAAEDGYVVAKGTWTPDGLIDKADIEIECVRTAIPQFSDSQIGVCLMAAAYLFGAAPAVSTNEYDIVVWGKTRLSENVMQRGK